MNLFGQTEQKIFQQTDLSKQLVVEFNNIRKIHLPKSRGIKPTTDFKPRLKQVLKIYTFAELRVIINNCFADTFHAEHRWKWITIEYILREKTIQRFTDAEINSDNDEGGYTYN